MQSKARWITIVVAVAGVGLCMAAVLQFLTQILHNGLQVSSENALRELYVAVGRSYTQGFIVGFFLCFFLTVAAVAVTGARERRLRSAPDLPQQ